MERQYTTKSLEDLIYDVRHTIGKVKDLLLKSIGGNPSKFNPADTRVSSYVDSDYLRESQQTLSQLIADIRNDELIAEYAKREDPSIQLDTNSITMMIQDYIGPMDSTLNFNELAQLSSLGEELYNRLEDAAKETRDLDHMTLLYLKVPFQNKLKECIERHIGNPSMPVSLAMLDLNNFKWYNDLVGHEQADELLKQFAKIMRNNLQGKLGRGSGGSDEFYILMEGVDAEGMEGILKERLLKEVDAGLIKNIRNARGEDYKPKFDDYGKKITLPVGITSTHLNGEKFFERMYAKLKNGAYAPLKKQLRECLDANLTESEIFNRLTDVERTMLVDKFAGELLEESDEMMKAAKAKTKEAYKEGKDAHVTSIYSHA